VLAPYVKADAEGAPLFRLPGTSRASRLPYLGYASGAYLGRVTDLILKDSQARPFTWTGSTRPTWPKA
jgi:hypothetical protein